MVARVLFPVLTCGGNAITRVARPASRLSTRAVKPSALVIESRLSIFYSQPGLIRQHELPMLHNHTYIWIIIDQ
jgi:hypothetical protein